MNYTPDFGWYYVSADDRAPAWSSVEFFYDFMTENPTFRSQNGGIGPFTTDVAREAVEIGDVIQFANRNGDWYHTVIISDFDGNEILVCAQSDNALDRPLSSYRNAVGKRFLHLEGVRINIDDTACFDALIAGEVAPADMEPDTAP